MSACPRTAPVPSFWKVGTALAGALLTQCTSPAASAPPAVPHVPAATAPVGPDAPPSDAPDHCLLFGTGYSFTLAAPQGWHALCGDELPEGRRELALAVPESVSTDPSRPIEPPFMYIVVGPKPQGEPVERFIAAENQRIAAGFEDPAQAPIASPHGELPLGDGTNVPVWQYEHAPSHRYELTAYAPYGPVVVFVSLVAPGADELEAMTRPFGEFVHSIHFVSANVHVGE